MIEDDSTDFPSTEEKVSFTIVFDLEDDKITKSQLSSPPTVNATPENQLSPRELVTEQESFRKHFFFNIRCPRQPLFGKFTKERLGNNTEEVLPACRVVLDVTFRTRLTNRKFKQALIYVAFYDGMAVDLDPDDDKNDAAIEAAGQFTPKILAFEPRQWRGLEDIREGQNKASAAVKVGDPNSGFGASGKWESTRPVIVPGKAEINGSITGMTSSVLEWDLKQNVLRNSGITPQFSLPIIVQYTPGRPFAARVVVKAKVEWGLGAIAAGELDDPIRFDPDKFAAIGRDEELNVDMTSLCNLDGYGGHFGVKGSKLD